MTIDQDVAEETRAFNAKLAEMLASAPRVYEVDDAAALRAGLGIFPEPVVLPQGADWRVPGRDGHIGIRVLTPPAVNGVFLHLHPGGLVLGSARTQDTRLWELATAAEVTVVSVEYRLAPEHPHPAAVHDCVDVAHWLISNTLAEFGTDRLAIGGESAGAGLAAQTLLRLRDRDGSQHAFRAAHLSYGAFDMSLTPSARLFGERNLVTSTPAERWFHAQAFPSMNGEELRDPEVSPLYADLRNLPPARFVAGTEDPLLDDTLFMAARWAAAGNDTIWDVVAEAVHGFTAFPITAAARELTRQAEYVGARLVR
jgi:acetyl esterase/lipase